MKYMLGLIMCIPLMGNAQFYDTFDDGDLSSSPGWSGDTHLFQVDTNLRLWLNAPPSSGEAFIATPSSAIDAAQWEWDAKMDFNPSASNHMAFYVVANQPSFNASFQGYYVKLGGTEDEVSLWRQDGTNHTEIIDGVDDLLDMNTVDIHVRLNRASDGLWSLFASLNGSSALLLQGTASDTTYMTSNFFGIHATYTSTRSDKFYTDNIFVSGNAYADTIPPRLEEVIVLSDQLELHFNEPLDAQTALSSNTYSMLRSGNVPVAVAYSDSTRTRIRLGFSEPFLVGKSHVLVIDGLKDDTGNASLLRHNFSWFDLKIPEPGDLIINEFMADPNPSIGLPEAEYIELYNPTGRYLTLKDLEVLDGSGSAQIEDAVIIPPSKHLVIVDVNEVERFDPSIPIHGIVGLPALNNSADEIRLKMQDQVLDSIAFNLEWYANDNKDDGGYSLERIDPYHPCSGGFNWRASEAESGGTPGLDNSVRAMHPDTSGPQVERSEVSAPNLLVVHFNEPLSSESIHTSDWQWSGSLLADSIWLSVDRQSCVVRFNTSLPPGSAHSVTLSNVSDCFGNTTDTLIAFANGKSAEPFDIVISEVRPKPSINSSLPEIEYIELYNRSSDVISTAGMAIADEVSEALLPPSLIWPGQFVLLVEEDPKNTFHSEDLIAVSRLPSLNDDLDLVTLKLENTLIDQLAYHKSWAHPHRLLDEGWSLERKDMNDLCGTRRNWSSSRALKGGTPGQPNSLPEPPQQEDGPLVEVFITSPVEIELNFGVRIDTVEVEEANVSIDDARIGKGPFIDRCWLALNEPLAPGSFFEASLVYWQCNGVKQLATSSTYVPQKGDVVINEVLFDPIDDGTDYVELFNASQETINLRGWMFPEKDTAADPFKYMISDTTRFIAPGGFQVISENNQNVMATYPFAWEENLYESNLPTYPNDAGSVILLNPFIDTMEVFAYDQNLHFPLVDDPEGVALERIDPALPAAEESSWHSASSYDHYGTPGYQNSQFVARAVQKGSQVYLENTRISPDGDGFEDVLLIRYKMNRPGHQLSAEIYRDDGIPIRSLASNLLIGEEGSVVWDGLNEEGASALTGIHIAVVEVFHIDGGRQRFKLPLVVAPKR